MPLIQTTLDIDIALDFKPSAFHWPLLLLGLVRIHWSGSVIPFFISPSVILLPWGWLTFCQCRELGQTYRPSWSIPKSFSSLLTFF